VVHPVSGGRENRFVLGRGSRACGVFSLDIWWVKIAIDATLGDDVVMFRLQSDLFLHLAEERGFQRLIRIHTALGKLPSAGDGPSPANQQVSYRIYE
jgi:hypothetical protein